MGADVPAVYHVIHTITESIIQGNAWWATQRFAVPISNPIQIVPANPKRTRLTVLNTDAVNTVDIATDSRASAGGSNTFPLAPGASIDMRHVREVWAVSNGAAVVVAVRSEFAERSSGSGGGEQ
jgi:hypothetical protein